MNRSPKLLHLASWKSIHVIEHKDQMSLKALVELLHPFPELGGAGLLGKHYFMSSLFLGAFLV